MYKKYHIKNKVNKNWNKNKEEQSNESEDSGKLSVHFEHWKFRIQNFKHDKD